MPNKILPEEFISHKDTKICYYFFIPAYPPLTGENMVHTGNFSIINIVDSRLCGNDMFGSFTLFREIFVK